MLRMKTGILILAILPYISNASSTFSNHCRNALYYTLYLDFISARNEINLELKDNTNNIYIPYLKNYIGFLDIVLNENPETIRDYGKNFKSCYNQIEESDENLSLKNQLLAELNLQSSVIYAKINERAKGFRYLYNSQKLIARHPEFTSQHTDLNKLTPAIILVNSYLPPILKHNVPLPDDYRTAFRLLSDYQEYVQKDSLLTLEYEILQSFLHLQFSDNTSEVFGNLKHKLKKYRFNPLLCWAYTLLALKNGNLNEASEILAEVFKRTDAHQFPFLYFLKGEIKTYSQFNGIGDFETFLKLYKGSNYVKTAWHKLKWNYFLRNDTFKYNYCRKMVTLSGTKWNDSDIEAARDAVDPQKPNIFLLKSRLLFDGGLYSKAREMLLESQALPSLSTEKDRLEYLYRFARINHATGYLSAAKQYYTQVINFGKNMPYYFAANSALQLGLIYETSCEKANAENFFRICLELNKFGYTSSIQAKAKAGLKRIKANNK